MATLAIVSVIFILEKAKQILAFCLALASICTINSHENNASCFDLYRQVRDVIRDVIFQKEFHVSIH